jgi:dynein heavy chain
LPQWFAKLNEQDDFDGLTVLFKPIIHTILLIWKNSAHYNVPMRLVVLMRMISNAVINQAVKFVSGSDAIFGFLEGEEFSRATETIRTALRVAGALKSTYFDFRDAAQNECPKRPWAVAPAAIFTRLNSFMERAMDMLELCNTYGNFFKLEKMVEGTGQAGGLGGTKGGNLTETVRDIYHIFKTASETLKTTGYDLFDISAPKFDEDYGKFKTTIKELERRLSAVIHLAFLDRTTPVAKFKLFESFDSLVKRSAIEDDLEVKYVHVVNDTLAQLLETQRCYLAHHDAPPIHSTAPNQPPVAGALVWAAGLYARMEAPMTKFRELGEVLLNREEAREVLKTAQALKATLHDFQEQKREEWRRDCMATFHIKLTLPLLIRHPPTKHHGGHLEVNFAPELVRLLREAKYFLSLNLESKFFFNLLASIFSSFFTHHIKPNLLKKIRPLPPTPSKKTVPQNAAELFAKAETFTVWCEQMDMICGLNNEMLDGMLPVEKPLLRPYMDKFNTAVWRRRTCL